MRVMFMFWGLDMKQTSEKLEHEGKEVEKKERSNDHGPISSKDNKKRCHSEKSLFHSGTNISPQPTHF